MTTDAARRFAKYMSSSPGSERVLKWRAKPENREKELAYQRERRKRIKAEKMVSEAGDTDL